MSILEAFKSFMDENFEYAVDRSTNAAYTGSGYSVELFEDGSYRVLWNNEIGNLYKSPGWILEVPSLCEDDDGEDRFYDNAEEQMRKIFDAEHRMRERFKEHY